jgi:hypothetical protein
MRKSRTLAAADTLVMRTVCLRTDTAATGLAAGTARVRREQEARATGAEQRIELMILMCETRRCSAPSPSMLHLDPSAVV